MTNLKSEFHYKVIDQCSICEGSHLEPVWHLPSLPLTEQFGTWAPDFSTYNQVLVFCQDCGHVQLKVRIDPSALYSPSEYAFRTGKSATARSFVDFFHSYLKKFDLTNNPQIVEIGGSDLYYAKMLAEEFESVHVIDPILKEYNSEVFEGIQIYGSLFENVDVNLLTNKKNIIICRHTLEHISSPISTVIKMIDLIGTDGIAFIEVPDFEQLIKKMRFDAIFHQHYHYFTLNTLGILIGNNGGEVIDFKRNYLGPNGGSILIAFKKSKGIVPCENKIQDIEDILEKMLKVFQTQMVAIKTLINESEEGVYGFGASLMLSNLNYHLDDSISNIVALLDDDMEKKGIGYKNVNIKVSHPSEIEIPDYSTFLVTSIESIRPIYKRVLSFNPRSIICPLVT